jgi:EmrB/QacA subfamily drug resistance transporter
VGAQVAGEAMGTPGPARPKRRWGLGSSASVRVFAVVAVALFMSSIDQTMNATALPTLSRDLHAGLNWSGWTITIYSFGLVLAMPVGGRISDLLGGKQVFLGAIALFTFSSLCCGLAPNMYLLIVFRAVQSLGAGIFLPSASGIVAAEFPDNRDRMIGSFASIFPIGGMVGPIIGGVIVGYWSWRWMFFINVPIGIALLFLGLKWFGRTPPKQVSGIDFRGIALFGSTLLAAMCALALIGERGVLPTVLALAALAVGVVLAVLFLRHATYSPTAFIPIRLLRGRTFGFMNLLNLVFGAAFLALGGLAPLYAEDRYHVDPVSAGTLLTARAFGIILVAGVSMMLLRRTGYRLPMIIGSCVGAVGLIMLQFTPPSGLSPVYWLVISTTICGIGMGSFMPAANNATLHLDPDQVAAVSGLRGMFRQAGFLIGVSVITATIARSTNPGITQAHAYLASAIIVLAVIPLVFFIPDYRGKW